MEWKRARGGKAPPALEDMVVPTLRLRDLVRAYTLRQHGMPLDVARFLVDGYAPLRVALRSYLGNGVRTYLTTDATGCEYLMQLVRRYERPEWDVTFVASAGGREGACRDWRPIIEQVVNDTVHKGAYRLYAAFPEASPLPLFFQQNGFRPFTRERIYRAGGTFTRLSRDMPAQIRPRLPSDIWNFSRLWRRSTPALVVAVESLPGNNSLDVPYHWSARPGQRVYVWEEDGELLGAMVLRQGRRAALMRLLLAPDADDEVGLGLIGWAVRLASPRPEYPLYAVVRNYQLGEYALLVDVGFQPYQEQTCLVRHLALPVGADEVVSSGLLSLLDIRGEAVYTQSLEPLELTLGSHGARSLAGRG